MDSKTRVHVYETIQYAGQDKFSLTGIKPKTLRWGTVQRHFLTYRRAVQDDPDKGQYDYTPVYSVFHSGLGTYSFVYWDKGAHKIISRIIEVREWRTEKYPVMLELDHVVGGQVPFDWKNSRVIVHQRCDTYGQADGIRSTLEGRFTREHPMATPDRDVSGQTYYIETIRDFGYAYQQGDLVRYTRFAVMECDPAVNVASPFDRYAAVVR